jgi:hypothetical protein
MSQLGSFANVWFGSQTDLTALKRDFRYSSDTVAKVHNPTMPKIA